MTVYFAKDRNVWRYDFRAAGKRLAGICYGEDGQPVTSKRAAKAVEAAIRAQALKGGEKPVIVPAAGPTLAEILEIYATHHGQHVDTWPHIRRHIGELIGWFGAGRPLRELTPALIDDYIAWSRAQPLRIYIGGPRPLDDDAAFKTVASKTRSVGLVNDYLTTLRAAINFVHRRDRDRYPLILIRRLDEPRHVPRSVRPEHVLRLVEAAAPHLRIAITLAVHTGMRLEEMLTRQLRHIDLDNRRIWFDPQDVKAGQGQWVAINDTLAAFLRIYLPTLDGPNAWLVTWKGQPVKSLRRSWETAIKAAQLEGYGYTFHKLHATFITALSRSGVGVEPLRKAARHRSITTTQRYIDAVDSEVAAAFSAAADLPVAGLVSDEKPEPVSHTKFPHKSRRGKPAGR